MKDHIQSAKVIIINMLITFVEAAGGSLLVADGLNRAALAGAAGAGGSAVWNLVIKPYLKSRTALYK